MTTELKPCPGGHTDPKLVIVDGWSKRSCRECGWNTYLHSTPQQADAEWNARPEEDRLSARIAELEADAAKYTDKPE